MKIQLIAPDLGEKDARIVPALAELGMDTYVPAGAVIDVPDELAGAAPYWRQPAPGDDTAFMETTHHPDGSIKAVHDLGRGLLAQVGIWAPAPKEGDE